MPGIDIAVFSAHSVWSSSINKVNLNIGLFINDIQKEAGWKSDRAFRKYIKLLILKNFGEELIKAYKQ